jgi:hypothetical protein
VRRRKRSSSAGLLSRPVKHMNPIWGQYALSVPADAAHAYAFSPKPSQS